MGVHERRRTLRATTGTVSIVPILRRPASSTKRFEIAVGIRGGRGAMESPDGDTVYLRVKRPDGSEFGGSTRLYDAATGGSVLPDSTDSDLPHAGEFWVQATVYGVGQARAFLEVSTVDAEEHLVVEAGWKEQAQIQIAETTTKISDAADADDIEDDTSTTVEAMGDFAGRTNLQTVLDYLGTLLDAASAPLGSMWGHQLFTATAVDDTHFDLTQVSGGAAVPPYDDILNAQYVVPLSGARAFERIAVADYDGTTNVGRVTHGSGAIATGTPILVLWDKVGNPWDSSAITFGSVDATLHGLLRRLATAFVGDPTGDTLDTLAKKLGDHSDAIGDNSLQAKVGEYDDTAVDAPTAGSLFARLAKVLELVASNRGVQRGTFTTHPYTGTAVLNADPADQEDAADQTTQSDSYVIVDKKTVALPEGSDASIESLSLTLVWTSQGTDGGGGGAGDTRWYISPEAATETAGEAPSGSAVAVSDEVAATTTKTTHRRSGVVPNSFLPGTAGVHLLLAAKVDDTQDTMACTIYDETDVEIDYMIV